MCGLFPQVILELPIKKATVVGYRAAVGIRNARLRAPRFALLDLIIQHVWRYYMPNWAA